MLYYFYCVESNHMILYVTVQATYEFSVFAAQILQSNGIFTQKVKQILHTARLHKDIAKMVLEPMTQYMWWGPGDVGPGNI